MQQLKIDKYRHQYSFSDAPFKESDLDHWRHFVNSNCMNGLWPFKTTFHRHKTRPWSYATMYLVDNAPPVVIAHGFTPNQGISGWFEFNPTKLGEKVGFLRAPLMLCLHTEGFGFVHHGHVGYAELFVDIDGAKHEDFFFIDSQLRTTNSFYEQDGTTYLGSRLGRRHVVCYAKEKQLREKEGLEHDCPLLRIEARIRPSVRTRLFNLPALPNPFANLLVVPRHELATLHLPLELSALRTRMAKGLSAQQAFIEVTHTTKGARSELVGQLRERRPAWWNPSKLWESAPGAVAWAKVLL